MKIAFQDSKIEFGELDKITDALKILDIEPISFGMPPFTIDVTGSESWTEPTILMGSTKLAKLYCRDQLPEYGIVFYDPEKFDQAHYIGILKSELLNSEARFYTYGSIKDTCINNPIFIKPSSDLKYFAGMVLEADGNSIDSALQNERMIDVDMSDDTIVLVNPDIIRDVQVEYRAFIVDNQIIDCCQYMKYGKVTPEVLMNDVRAQVYAYIRKIQEIYAPHDHYVIDIAELSDGTYKVVEYNCINCSGIYVNDRVLIYKRLTEL